MRYLIALIRLCWHCLVLTPATLVTLDGRLTIADHRMCSVHDGSGQVMILFCMCGKQFYDRWERPSV